MDGTVRDQPTTSSDASFSPAWHALTVAEVLSAQAVAAEAGLEETEVVHGVGYGRGDRMWSWPAEPAEGPAG